jgi:hypothetical protein
MIKKILAILFLFIAFLNLQTQAQTTEKTFDFWIGKWNAYWDDSLKGNNDITKTLGGFIIEENFSAKYESFYGKSWSVFDSASNSWMQTWVDNTGAYLTFFQRQR